MNFELRLRRHAGRGRARRPVATGIAAALLVGALAMAGCSAGTLAGEQESTDAAATTAPPSDSLLVRKDAKDLSSEEKSDLVEAILALKELPPPTEDTEATNWYDYFVALHAEKVSCTSEDPNQGGYGHSGPDILTWHRAFLLDFEDALSTAAGKPIAIPYWDWTDPESTAATFAPDLMGPSGSPSDGYAVMEGAFRKGEWIITIKPAVAKDPEQRDYVVRALGTSPAEPPSSADWNTALAIPAYDAPPYDDSSSIEQSFRNFANGAIGATDSACVDGLFSAIGIQGGRMHDQGHGYVAGMTPEGIMGTMHDTATSPNDPSFWLHHANVDRLAENWWALHDYEFLPTTGGPIGGNIDDIMEPYEYTNGDMATPATDLGYAYDQPESETVPQDGATTSSLDAPASSHSGH